MIKVDDLLARFIPRRCALCRGHSGARCVCADCLADMPWLTRRCPGCGRQLRDNEASCPVCAEPVAETAGRVLAACTYEYPVDRMITAVKFHGRLHFTRALGDILACALERSGATTPDLLVPVPLHHRRLVERGYNQALEIARPVAKVRRIALAPGLCERVRHTAEQSGLSGRERRRNLRGAFAVRGDCAGARIALLDDVITTGSTAAALAQTLKKAGAAQVETWAVARSL